MLGAALCNMAAPHACYQETPCNLAYPTNVSSHQLPLYSSKTQEEMMQKKHQKRDTNIRLLILKYKTFDFEI